MVALTQLHRYLKVLYGVYAIRLSAGLPNITSTGSLESITYGPAPQGAIYASKGANIYSWLGEQNAGTVYYWIIDASRCSSIYGSSTTVTPLSLKVVFIIKYI